MSDDFDWNKIYDEIARQLHEEKEVDTNDLYNYTSRKLVEALQLRLDYNGADKKIYEALHSNIIEFSYAKTLFQINHFKELLFDNKKLLPLASFKKVVADQGEIFNNRYLATEYDMVVQSAVMANKWSKLDAEYLQFTTAGDGRVRPTHHKLDKFTAKKDDPIWKRLYPPLDWGCRCGVIPGKANGVKEDFTSEMVNNLIDPEIKNTVFDNNVGISLKAFTDKHPYFQEKKTDQEKKDIETLYKSSFFTNNLTFLSNKVKDAFPTISIEKINSVNMYSGRFYDKINRFNRKLLTEFEPQYGHTKEFYNAITRTINKALDEIPTKHVGMVYRGISGSGEKSKKIVEPYRIAFENKKKHVELSFLSSSYDEKESFSGNIFFEIKSKTGAIIESISKHDNEKEVLFKAGQKFKVTNFEDKGDDKFFIQMEEI